MNGNHLNKEQLARLNQYKYSSIDSSPLSNYVFHPFWNQAVRLVPRWISPNVLTFAGFLLTIVNTLVLAYYDYGFHASSDIYQPVPAWVWLVCAVNQFLSHTLDGIDGKHARRIKSCSLLGELMDHGLDSWAAAFRTTCMYSVFGRGEFGCSPLRFFFLLCCVNFCFLLSEWEKYNTGTYCLPWNSDIFQSTLHVLFLVRYFNPNSISIFTALSIGSLQLLEISVYVGGLGMVLPLNFYNMYSSYRAQRLKRNSINECLCPLFPAIFLFTLTTCWALFSPNDIINRDPRMFFWMTGTVFSNIMCRLIVAQFTSSPCEVTNLLLYPVAVVMFLVFGASPISEIECLLLRIVTLVILVAHINYGVSVVRQLCSHFQIHCFSLKSGSNE